MTARALTKDETGPTQRSSSPTTRLFAQKLGRTATSASLACSHGYDSRGHDRPDAASRVAALRDVMSDAALQVTEVRSDGSIVLLGEETVDRLTGQQMLDGMAQFLSAFNLLEPVAELGRKRLWGPDLLTPSHLAVISPWVMGGEPVVRSTRIPTASLHALRHERGLETERIVALYPGLDTAQVDDAIELEDRLRRAA